jgi:DNA helicase-2/ATP-dependent DNA helicase PcrA
MSAVDDVFDAEADEAILACLDMKKPRSFFLYAGAGSGKTRSLVEAIRAVCREQGRRLSLTGQKIGVITYTNGIPPVAAAYRRFPIWVRVLALMS